jgi:hypothetical protein
MKKRQDISNGIADLKVEFRNPRKELGTQVSCNIFYLKNSTLSIGKGMQKL